jgi:hypothetical protein
MRRFNGHGVNPRRQDKNFQGGRAMKRTWLFVIAGMVITLALLGQGPVAKAAQCSQSGVAGKYGFTLSGVVITNAPVPIAAVGKAILDASGSVTGTEARSVGGGFADETFTGTYTVNSDCTGTTTLQFFENGNLVRTSVLSIAFDNNEREIRMVQKSLQLPNGAFLPVVITVEARRTFTEDD